MLWNLVIDPAREEQLKKTVTVEADNWHDALETGLRRHDADSVALSNLSCSIEEDKSVIVSDSVSRRIFRLAPFEPTPLSNTASASESESDILPKHNVFLEKDEAPEESDGIFYRERIITSEALLDRTGASSLVSHYFDTLKRIPPINGEKRFITVQLYDHEFETHAQRPAVAVLTWKEWQTEHPEIIFPLSGDEGVTFNKTVSSTVNELPESAQHSEIVEENKETLLEDAQELSKAEVTENVPETGTESIEDGMIAAFEKMQDIFGLKEHDEAAAFLLSVARESIPSDAAECLLVSPKKYEFYVSAVAGDVQMKRQGLHLSMTQGLTGFVATNSVVLNVKDPMNDDRFDAAIDTMGGVSPQHLLIAPMQFEGELIGIISLSTVSSERGFSEQSANILSYLASSFAEFATTYLPTRQEAFTDQEFAPPVSKPQKPTVSRQTQPRKSAENTEKTHIKKNIKKTTTTTENNKRKRKRK